ncbi:maltose acetyltransferase domain-containing protein [uncultured Paenibacillus sp.]|uniref:maltose acetyltransferase domain-containing protein n=1 Tax=uncultured Paenibacillus sp. TaxID=227322 RepID=UPI0037DC8403
MKTEKEKMLSGELYHAGDPELTQDRLNARKLTRLFNETLETDLDHRTKLLKTLWCYKMSRQFFRIFKV